MTATEKPIETTTPGTWARDLAALQARYPKVREPILAALLAITQNPDAELENLKAIAAEHGVRITAASVAAAHRLRSRQDGGGPAPAPRMDKAAAKPAAPNTARVRRPRRPPAAVDPETLIRGVVAEIQNAGNAPAERLRDAMHKAIEVLQAAVQG